MNVIDLRKQKKRSKPYSDTNDVRGELPKTRVFRAVHKKIEATNFTKETDIREIISHQEKESEPEYQEIKCVLVGGWFEDKSGKSYIAADKSKIDMSSDFFKSVPIFEQDLLELYGLKPEECHTLETGNRNWESELRGLSKVERGDEFIDGGGTSARISVDLPILGPLQSGDYEGEKKRFNL